MADPMNSEIAACLGKFFLAGDGPAHAELTRTFDRSGFSSDDPYDPSLGSPNKERRVLAVCDAANRRPGSVRRLVDELLTTLRVAGCFQAASVGAVSGTDFAPRVSALHAALRRVGWGLSDAGVLTTLGAIDLETGGRAALDEQIHRMRTQVDDPGGLIGSAKDLLESTLKFVLERAGMPISKSMPFPGLLHVACERLGILPKNVDATTLAGPHVRDVYQSAYRIAESVDRLRNVDGAGHGRTLPTGVSVDDAHFVARQVCLIADFLLATLDRKYGRQV